MPDEDGSQAGDVRKAKAMAQRIIAHHIGEKPQRTVFQASGLTNFVFRVSHAEGEFVVRISPDAVRLQAFIKEQWATREARRLGVPTPEILEVGNEVVPYPYMISRTVAGHEATSHPDRLLILREMGRYASLINSIPTHGFGATFDWSNNQLSRNETWSEFLSEELKLEARLEILRAHRMLPDRTLESVRSMLEGLGDDEPRPALNHGDLRLKNVIVDDGGHIAAIIDWEHCTSNIAPQWELSIALHDLSIDEKQELLDGYGLTEDRIVEIAPLVKAINLVNYAHEVERLAEAGDTPRIERYRTRLGGALDLYSP